MPNERPTLRNIADSLGVSVNTVSRALNKKSGVGEVTRTRIQLEAERIGYVPNPHARSLVLGSRMLIGMVISNPSNPFYAGLISEIEKHAGEEDYSIILFSSDESSEQEDEAAQAMLRAGVDGAIVAPVQGKTNPWYRLVNAEVPIVTINREMPDLALDLVRTDNFTGMYRATQHVLDQGARNVFLLEEDLAISTVDDRTSGFRAALKDAGLAASEDAVTYVSSRRRGRAMLPWLADQAHLTMLDLLDRGQKPDAIITGNDLHALGAMRALHERSISVPDDVLVVGWGDYPFSAYLAPSLTSVRLPIQRVGRIAFEMMLRRIRREHGEEPERHTMRPEIVVRESSRAVK